MIALGYGKRSGESVLLCGIEDGEPLEAGAPIDGILVSRLDFDVQVLDIPSVPEKEMEGLIRYRLRSIYPGNPSETAFDFRLETEGRLTRAVVSISKNAILDSYRTAAEQRTLFLPYCFYAEMARKMKNCRIVFRHREWTEQTIFQNGLPVSSSARRRGKGKSVDISWLENDLSEEVRALPVLVIASALEIADMKIALPEDKADSMTFLDYSHLLSSPKKPLGVFVPRRPETFLSKPSVRIASLAAAVLILGIALFFKYVANAESVYNALKARYNALETRNRAVLTLQKEVDDLNAELERLQAEKPQDLYAFLSELSAILGGETRIRRLTFQGDAFQIEAIGANPLKLMEGFKDRPSFRNVRLAQVVPDAASGRERFSFSGVFHAR